MSGGSRYTDRRYYRNGGAGYARCLLRGMPNLVPAMYIRVGIRLPKCRAYLCSDTRIQPLYRGSNRSNRQTGAGSLRTCSMSSLSRSLVGGIYMNSVLRTRSNHTRLLHNAIQDSRTTSRPSEYERSYPHEPYLPDGLTSERYCRRHNCDHCVCAGDVHRRRQSRFEWYQCASPVP